MSVCLGYAVEQWTVMHPTSRLPGAIEVLADISRVVLFLECCFARLVTRAWRSALANRPHLQILASCGQRESGVAFKIRQNTKSQRDINHN